MILKTGATTAVGSTMKTLPLPSLERATERIEVRPELSTKVTFCHVEPHLVGVREGC
jgi:hypothetical protein